MNVDLIAEEQPSRYVVGIDLGTTNSAVCYVDSPSSRGRCGAFFKFRSLSRRADRSP